MNTEEESAKRHLLDELVHKHRQLDEKINNAMDEEAYMDQLFLQRIKREKLQLKDQIEQIRSSLIPDLDA